MGMGCIHKSQANVTADFGFELQLDIEVEADLQARMAGLASSCDLG